jgi:phosphatidylserine decarboxylase
VNILTRNRRAVIEIRTPSNSHVAMIVVGGVTVDSIRLEQHLRVGSEVKRGDMAGAFARGGSSVALLFQHPPLLNKAAAATVARGLDFKLDVCDDLAEFVDKQHKSSSLKSS